MTDERKAEILDELMNIKQEVVKYHNSNLEKVEEYHKKVEWAINKKERKQYLKDTCITMYKDIFLNDKNITYAVSDAALIALWCLERKNRDG